MSCSSKKKAVSEMTSKYHDEKNKASVSNGQMKSVQDQLAKYQLEVKGVLFLGSVIHVC
jgi:hypothetical protein